MLIGLIISMIIYVIGIAACTEVFGAIGRANPRSICGSWTGDGVLDLLSLIFWPVSLLVIIGLQIGRMLACSESCR